jgi:hypothetical protein
VSSGPGHNANKLPIDFPENKPMCVSQVAIQQALYVPSCASAPAAAARAASPHAGRRPLRRGDRGSTASWGTVSGTSRLRPLPRRCRQLRLVRRFAALTGTISPVDRVVDGLDTHLLSAWQPPTPAALGNKQPPFESLGDAGRPPTHHSSPPVVSGDLHQRDRGQSPR